MKGGEVVWRIILLLSCGWVGGIFLGLMDEFGQSGFVGLATRFLGGVAAALFLAFVALLVKTYE